MTPSKESPGDRTIRSYDLAAEAWLERSWPEVGADMAAFIDQFTALAGVGPVLEIGSGGGWIADHLEGEGVEVVRSDATSAFIEHLRARGHEVRRIDVRTDALGGPWVGVLASAVLLHLTEAEFADAVRRICAATLPLGVFGMTLKEGDGEEWTSTKISQPRYFRYWREPQLRRVLTDAGWSVLSLDHSSFRDTPWLNVLATPATSPPRTVAAISGTPGR